MGQSRVEADKLEVAQSAMKKAEARKVQFLLPSDNVVATPVKTEKLDKKGRPVIEWQNPQTVPATKFPQEAEGLDIGPETAKKYVEIISKAKTILWNGPMGFFEDKRFAEGTNAVARAVAEVTEKNGAVSIIGGGDSVKALNKAGLGKKVTFMSTGGGASLEFLEGKELPGVAALTDKK
jgi:phosphoglycerate kinase